MSRRAPDATSRFLAAQSAAAKAEMGRSLSSAIEALPLDPKAWVGAYPLASLMVAAALGFVAAPRKRGPGKRGIGDSSDEKGSAQRSRFLRIATLLSLGLLRNVLRRIGRTLGPALRKHPPEPVAHAD